MADGLRITLAVLLSAAVVVVFTLAPSLLSRNGYHWTSVAVAFIALVVWIRLVPPMPGFAQGVICLTGATSILSVLLICLALLIRNMLIRNV